MLTLVDTGVPEFRPEPLSAAEGAAMFRAVVNLFARWGLTDEQSATLLDMPLRSFRRWKTGEPGRLGRDGKARLSNLMASTRRCASSFASRRAATPGSRRPTTPSAGDRR